MREIDLTPLKEAKNPVLLCSFGKESLVLLKQVMSERPDTAIIHFYDHLSPFASQIISEWNLSVSSYAPACRYRVEDTVVSEYAIGNARLPLLQDISAEGKQVGTITTPRFDYGFDLSIFGYRKSDTHPLVNAVFPQRFALGPTQMYAPLWDWEDSDVFEALGGTPYEPYNDDAKDDGLPIVSREMFQARFGLSH